MEEAAASCNIHWEEGAWEPKATNDFPVHLEEEEAEVRHGVRHREAWVPPSCDPREEEEGELRADCSSSFVVVDDDRAVPWNGVDGVAWVAAAAPAAHAGEGGRTAADTPAAAGVEVHEEDENDHCLEEEGTADTALEEELSRAPAAGPWEETLYVPDEVADDGVQVVDDADEVFNFGFTHLLQIFFIHVQHYKLVTGRDLKIFFFVTFQFHILKLYLIFI